MHLYIVKELIVGETHIERKTRNHLQPPSESDAEENSSLMSSLPSSLPFPIFLFWG